VQNSTAVFQLNFSNNISFCASKSRPNAKPQNVSGNRRFGLRDNGDGTYTFFTQGVDRLTGWWHILADATPFINAFDDADQLWVCLLGHIKTIVENKQGSVSDVYEIQKCRPRLPEYNDFLYERCNDDPSDLFESPCGN